MKKKKNLFIIIGIIAAVLAVIILIPKGNSNATMAVKNISLKTTKLQNTISSTGVVESTDSQNIYSSLTYPVKSINVKVGDTVKAGDILCLIDSVDLTDQISQKKASMNSNNVTSFYQLTQSEKKYNEAKNDLDNGSNAELSSAQSAIKTAELELNNAKTKYDNAQKTQNDANNAKLLTAKTELNDAEINYNSYKNNDYYKVLTDDKLSDKQAISKAEDKLASAKAALKAAKDTLLAAQGKDNATIAAATEKVNAAQKVYDDDLKALYDLLKTDDLLYARQALKSYEDAYDQAKENFDNLVNGIGGELAQYKLAVDSAQISYDKAKTAYDATKTTVEQQLNSYKDDMEKDQKVISSDPQLLELAGLQRKLDECTVTSPISGTVTAVNIKQGAMPSGSMFIIEDTNSLKIKAKIKEYDIESIAKDMKVIIKSDATGEDEYEGSISDIAPTAIKDVTGAAGGTGSTSSDTQFEYTVSISSQNTKLLIGMTTRLNIITKEKDNVFAVRSDAIGKNKDGKDIVYVAKENGKNLYKVEEVPVTTGLETDFDVEVSGDGLKEGTIIITDIGNIKAGSIVRLSK